MELSKERIESLRELLAPANRKIVIVAHTNPDGDAVGSSLAWAEVLRGMGHEVTCIVPNKYPYFLDWMPGIGQVVVFKNDTAGDAVRAIAEADLLFCLDFNAVSRLEILSDTIEANTTARRVLIDHHLSPDGHFDLSFSYPDSSSTCFLVYSIIEALFGTDAITRQMAESLYVGMMTDTGNFAFSFLTPELFRAVAVLVEKGISIPEIHNNVYNAYTEGRARLFGYVINRKMEIIQDGTVAYMSLMENEMRRFQFQQGDSEGFVNYALTIKKVKMSAMFLAHRKFIRISLRSRGDVDVNLFARRYFNGGGHNISGLLYRATAKYEGHRAGLFPVVGAGALITNFSVSDSVMSVGWCGGAAAGYTELDSAENFPKFSYIDVRSTVNITGTVVGGILGGGSFADFDNCCVTAELSGRDELADTPYGTAGDLWGIGGVNDVFYSISNSYVSKYSPYNINHGLAKLSNVYAASYGTVNVVPSVVNTDAMNKLPNLNWKDVWSWDGEGAPYLKLNASGEYNSYALGDTDCDGTVGNSKDLAVMRKHLLRVEGVFAYNADLNEDGTVDIRDFIGLKKSSPVA